MVRVLIPGTMLGVVRYVVDVKKSDERLLGYFDKTVKEIGSRYEMSEIAEIPHIRETREAYKALGKSPSQYRNAAEAMLRRIVKGNGLYKINNVVEINNLISIRSGYSVGSYDKHALKGEIELRPAPAGERYEGIGKSNLNIENLPVLFDEEGAFGNPTSDSKRAMIQEGKREVMSVIYAFHLEQEELEKWLAEYRKLLEQFTDATAIQTEIIMTSK